MDKTFLEERITKAKAQLVAWEDASLALSGGAQSYTIDTGQTRQTVTRYNMTEVERNIDRLLNRIATLEARLNGSGSTNARPAW